MKTKTKLKFMLLFCISLIGEYEPTFSRGDKIAMGWDLFLDFLIGAVDVLPYLFIILVACWALFRAKNWGK